MESRKLALRCRELANDKKAEDVIVLDVRKVSSVTDYFVLATGSSEPHLRAIAGEIKDRLHEEEHVKARTVDGTLSAGWIVMDFSDVIVHLMRADQRSKYDLEGLWGDAPKVRGSSRAKPKAKPKAAAKPKRSATKS